MSLRHNTMPHSSIPMLRSGLLEVLWPTRCVGCDKPGELLCEKCRNYLYPIDQSLACPRCGAPAGKLVCTECTLCLERTDETYAQNREAPPDTLAGLISDLDGVRSYAMLEWPLDRMIRAYKDEGERRLASYFAEMLAQTSKASRHDAGEDFDCIVFVPCTPEAFSRRGYDHMQAIADALSDMLNVSVDDVLARRAKKDQRRLGRQDRAHNVKNSFAVLHDMDNKNVLLIDDVFTTGATLGAAGRALKQKGARRISALTIARGWQS